MWGATQWLDDPKVILYCMHGSGDDILLGLGNQINAKLVSQEVIESILNLQVEQV